MFCHAVTVSQIIEIANFSFFAKKWLTINCFSTFLSIKIHLYLCKIDMQTISITTPSSPKYFNASQFRISFFVSFIALIKKQLSNIGGRCMRMLKYFRLNFQKVSEETWINLFLLHCKKCTVNTRKLLIKRVQDCCD